MAIDRKAISDKLFDGKQPIAHGGISDARSDVQPGGAPVPYDPAAARKLLDEAGFADIKNGVRQNARASACRSSSRTTAGNRVRELVAQVIQSQLRQVGIEVRIKAEPPRIFSEALNRRQFSGLAMYAWVQQPEGVPRSILHSDEIPSAENGWSGQNYPGYRNPDMDKALDAAERELDPTKRRALFAEIQRIHADDLPVAAAVLPRRSLRDPQAAQGRGADRPPQQLDPVDRAVALGELDGARQGGARRQVRAPRAAGRAPSRAGPAGGAASRDLHRHRHRRWARSTIPISTTRSSAATALHELAFAVLLKASRTAMSA